MTRWLGRYTVCVLTLVNTGNGVLAETLHECVRAACNVALSFVHLLSITHVSARLQVCVCV